MNLTSEHFQKIGIAGLMGIAIIFLYHELQETKNEMYRQRQEHKLEIRDLRNRHEKFVDMMVERYQIPLTK